VNSVADRCAFHWDMRLVPGQPMEEVTERFDAYARSICAADPRFEISRVCEAYFPGLRPSPDTAFRQAVLAATEQDRFEESPMGTEAGFFQSAGFDTLIWGPGDPAHAHIADESTAIHQLERCLSRLTGPSGLIAMD
jgi:acetylornithine deacetylase